VGTPANAGDRAQVADLSAAIQDATGDTIEVVDVDQGDPGQASEDAAASAGICLEVVTLPDPTRGFGLLPRCWVVERTFGWLTRYRRLSKDSEELPETSEVMILIAMSHLMLKRLRQ
jgi:transposase